ncbi:hypothetical protein [Mobilicoccus caccae]|uniref:Uncharacterized protein n=1 Tax=Mobilicoccus caccae TaxID=1859295 RepID=A0ABQ6IPN5_9MICO|nr:hypothetical protein [Mobilicoccus caccae]GMA38677.1 hypothetical protein GCM10025883_07220 [Mobilicoccus caccae]
MLTHAQRGHRDLRWAALDASAWAAALFASVWLRYDFRPERVFALDTWIAVAGVVVVHLVAGAVLRLYGRSRVRGSYEEAVDLTIAVAVTAVVLLVWLLIVYPPLVPRSSPARPDRWPWP